MVRELLLSVEAVNYVWEVLHSDEMRVALPAEFCPFDFVAMVDQWKDGDCFMFLPERDNMPMGLIWGATVSAYEFEGHYCFFKEFHGAPAKQVTAECMELIHSQLGSTRFLGLIPKKNRRSLAFARTLGFRGNRIRYVERYGDCVMVNKDI